MIDDSSHFCASSAQLGIWYALQLNPDSAAWNIGEYVEVHRPISRKIFEQAVNFVVEETDAIRAYFSENAGGHAAMQPLRTQEHLLYCDFSGDPDPRAHAQKFMEQSIRERFDISRGPLFAFSLLKISDSHFIVMQKFHHIVVDGHGMWLIARRLFEVYAALENDAPVPARRILPLPSFLDIDRLYLQSTQFSDDEVFWRDYVNDWPQYHERVAKSDEYRRETVSVPLAWNGMLRDLAKEWNFTTWEAFIALFCAFFHRFYSEDQIAVGLPVSNRKKSNWQTPGCISNVIPFRIRVNGSLSFLDVLKIVRHEAASVFKHKEYPVHEIRRLMTGGQYDPLGITLNYMPFDYAFDGFKGQTKSRMLSAGHTPNLRVAFYDRCDEEIYVDFEGNAELFDHGLLRSVSEAFARVIERVIFDPSQPIGRIDLLDAAERRQLLVDWNDTAQPLAD
ncbi:condensation domain-containing protein, partial [Agrobacterium tumefaciens]|uniref:condensation domain-containing protein n=1 Tax=Agrobacterium tumefaciens TaxID=358 RepID=UPI001146DD05